MKQKTLLLTLYLILLLSVAYGQCNSNISQKGYAHIKAAQTLTEMASSINDWKDVAFEYEQVLATDPDYAPVYMTLGDLYTKIGNEEGSDAFRKAKYYYNGCKTACADSSDAVEVKLTILNALERKYDNGPNKFVGMWGKYYDTEFSKFANISYNGNSYEIELVGDYCKSGLNIIRESTNEIVFEYHSILDYRDELRNKGFTYYYDDCDYLADPGYSTYGTYKYDYIDSRWTESITITNDGVYRNFIEKHSDHFLKGQKTYAETKINPLFSQKLEKLQ